MTSGLHNYLTITFSYWAFTITDGALRMLVVLYFHMLGYSPFEVAMLFLFYEFFGVVTNLVGGWLGSRIGLNMTMHIGMILQVSALLMLTVSDDWLTVIYVMSAQALSGIAKDLNKMSAKASIKFFIQDQDSSERLFKWVARLTGSKNTLKGAGFFIGAALLQWIEYRPTLYLLAGLLFMVLIISWRLLPHEIGKLKHKPKFKQVFSQKPAINWLSTARFFLFGARDIWFVVALPVFLSSTLQWSHTQIGSFFALWIIGYGVIQAMVPDILKNHRPSGNTAFLLATCLAVLPAIIAQALNFQLPVQISLITGLSLFGVIFAFNSAVHSFLIVDWSEQDKAAMNVGFYYMANAGGRLIGTILSGGIYQMYGLEGCLYASSIFIVLAAGSSIPLKRVN